MTQERSILKDVLELAECLARLGGYRNFSFRDLAAGTGLSSSSIRSHFPSKEQLAVAVVRRFGERVYERVGPADDASVPPGQKIDTLIEIYRETITDDGQLCLSLVFGAELYALPKSVQDEVRKFFANVFAWLEAVLKRCGEYAPGTGRDPARAARTIIAALNGAQICVRAAEEPAMFDDIVMQMRTSGLLPDRRLRDK